MKRCSRCGFVTEKDIPSCGRCHPVYSPLVEEAPPQTASPTATEPEIQNSSLPPPNQETTPRIESVAEPSQSPSAEGAVRAALIWVTVGAIVFLGLRSPAYTFGLTRLVVEWAMLLAVVAGIWLTLPGILRTLNAFRRRGLLAARRLFARCLDYEFFGVVRVATILAVWDTSCRQSCLGSHTGSIPKAQRKPIDGQ
jgi:hypothetical protein